MTPVPGRRRRGSSRGCSSATTTAAWSPSRPVCGTPSATSATPRWSSSTSRPSPSITPRPTKSACHSTTTSCPWTSVQGGGAGELAQPLELGGQPAVGGHRSLGLELHRSSVGSERLDLLRRRVELSRQPGRELLVELGAPERGALERRVLDGHAGGV